MISDAERREVARRLRGLDHVVTNCDTIESGVNKFIKAVYGDRPYSPIECSTRNLCGLAMTLADLIDRPTCSMEYRPGWSGDEIYPTRAYECSVCGHIVMDGKPDYCPRCGAEVVYE